jgi:polyhydroxybutyrate depolymerase
MRLAGLIARLLVLAVVGAGVGAPPAAAADGCAPCRVTGGSYRVLAPSGWDGRQHLPVLIFLHGAGGAGTDVLDNPEITGPAERMGWLLVAPNGFNRVWSHQGAPALLRDDRSFLRAVAADVKKRWPVDPHMIVLGGFSQGASMVWDMACLAPLGFQAFLPFSGGFWERMPTACTAPVNLRHVHGSADGVVPLKGRVVRERWRQADIQAGFQTWRETDRCTAPPTYASGEGDLSCAVWSCRTRRTLELCLHPGGHEMRAAWLEEGLAWARDLPPSK